MAAARHGFQDGIWPDVLGFGLGLGLAWWLKWGTTDLVWSLWLSSLVVGYSMIVWSIFSPMAFIGTKAWQDRELVGRIPAGKVALGGTAVVIGALFLLAFFTFHFGLFHFVHSAFLEHFFPVHDRTESLMNAPMATYGEVVRRYWIFLPAAFLAERKGFRFHPPSQLLQDISVKPADIEARKKRQAQLGGAGLMAPYKNVVRMHLLIFFFAAAHIARLDSFLVYAVVYAVYFFPWRLLRKEKPVEATAG